MIGDRLFTLSFGNSHGFTTMVQRLFLKIQSPADFKPAATIPAVPLAV